MTDPARSTQAPISPTRRRPLRADARHNRERILHAATEVFGTWGPDASTEEVARLAGFGIGTVFRHFKTKQVLLAAVADQALAKLSQRLQLLTDGQPNTIAALITEATQDPVLRSLLGSGASDALFARWTSLIGDLLTVAQHEGTIRADIDAASVVGLLQGLCHANRRLDLADATHHAATRVVIDGLQPRHSAPAPHEPDGSG